MCNSEIWRLEQLKGRSSRLKSGRGTAPQSKRGVGLGQQFENLNPVCSGDASRL